MNIKSAIFSLFLPVFTLILFAFTLNGQTLKNNKSNKEFKESAAFFNMDDALQQFEKSDNPNYRSSILKKFAQQYGTDRLLSSAESNGVDRIIGLGLKDKYSKVTVEAIKNVGVFKRRAFENTLLSAYKEAPQSYPGYWERVQLSIISSLGKIGGDETKKFLRTILSTEENAPVIPATLETIKELHDVSMVKDLDMYCNKIEAIIADARNRGDDPMLYSSYLANDKIARNTIKSLLAERGN